MKEIESNIVKWESPKLLSVEIDITTTGNVSEFGNEGFHFSSTGFDAS